MKKVFILILLLILLTGCVQTYEPFTWDGENCETYIETCWCLGSLLVMESYPMQYACKGIDYCKDTEDRIECR